jgi:hypothetical protein
MLRPPPSPRLALALAWGLLAAVPAASESDLLLDLPESFGTVDAATYDVNRNRVGDAHLVMERIDGGNVQLISQSGFTGGAHTVITATFEPAARPGKLRPLRQESRSFDPAGNPLGRLLIDHADGVARCFDPQGAPSAELEIPSDDRVANTALSLLFLPLVRNETEVVEFQLFFCGLGTRFVPFTANRVATNGKRPNVIEVRYGPDFGFATMVASSFVPRLSFWFDPKTPHRWMAHRLPLYGKGPEVFVVRKGIPPRWLGDE